MKRKTCLAVLAMCLVLAAGCGDNGSSDTDTTKTEDTKTDTAQDTDGKKSGSESDTRLVSVDDIDKYITLGEYKGIVLTKSNVQVTDEDVDNRVTENLKDNMKEVTQKGATVQDGDAVTINFVGKKDGVAFEGGSGNNYDLTIGSGTMIPGFEEGIIGMKKGDTKDVEVTFPEDYRQTDLAGQDAVFQITLQSFRRAPEFTDEWVTDNTDYANMENEDGQLEQVDPDDVEIGSVIVVKPGERVPIDGIVLERHSSLNTAALTGESLPRDVEPGNEIISGSINLNGLLKVRTTKEFGESTASKILELIEDAGSRKSKSEEFITKFARVYTPIVVWAAIALAVIPPVVLTVMDSEPMWGEWLYRALTFLIISCPCALVISIPLSFFAGLGAASRHGILVKGSNYMETLSETKTVVFDIRTTIGRKSGQTGRPRL